MNKPNPECPSCQGGGMEEHFYDEKTKTYGDRINPCPLCDASWQQIYDQLARYDDTYSGNSRFLKAMTTEEQDAVWSGAIGAEYRRLLKWLWRHADQGPGGSKYRFETKKERSIPFAKLFSFERKVTPPKPKAYVDPVYIDDPLYAPSCTVAVADLLPAWKQLVKVAKPCNLPILETVKIEVTDGRLLLTTTDLEQWCDQSCRIASGQAGDSYCVNAKTMLSILRVCPKDAVLQFRLAELAPKPYGDPTLLIRCRLSTWKLYPLPVSNFPCRREELHVKTA